MIAGMPPTALPPVVDATVRRYLGVADLLLPGRVVGFYLIGSVALGAFRPGRSDIDFVAVLDDGLDGGELRRLRAVHAAAGLRTVTAALARGEVTLPFRDVGTRARTTAAFVLEVVESAARL